MPTELKGVSALRKALKQFDPDLDKETRDEMVGFLKPLVKKARGFMPSNKDMPSGFVGSDQSTVFEIDGIKLESTKTSKGFPKYDATLARRGVGYKLTPTKPNRQGWISTVSIHNKTAGGAIYETAGRKSGIVGNFTPRLKGTLAGQAKMSGRAMFKAYEQDQGKARAGVIKALEKAAAKFNARGNSNG
jgi:hypothetical protein